MTRGTQCNSNENSNEEKTHCLVGPVNHVMRTLIKRGTHLEYVYQVPNEEREERNALLSMYIKYIMRIIMYIKYIIRTIMGEEPQLLSIYIDYEDSNEDRNTLLSMYIKYIMRTLTKRGTHC